MSARHRHGGRPCPGTGCGVEHLCGGCGEPVRGAGHAATGGENSAVRQESNGTLRPGKVQPAGRDPGAVAGEVALDGVDRGLVQGSADRQYGTIVKGHDHWIRARLEQARRGRPVARVEDVVEEDLLEGQVQLLGGDVPHRDCRERGAVDGDRRGPHVELEHASGAEAPVDLALGLDGAPAGLRLENSTEGRADLAGRIRPAAEGSARVDAVERLAGPRAEQPPGARELGRPRVEGRDLPLLVDEEEHRVDRVEQRTDRRAPARPLGVGAHLLRRRAANRRQGVPVTFRQPRIRKLAFRAQVHSSPLAPSHYPNGSAGCNRLGSRPARTSCASVSNPPDRAPRRITRRRKEPSTSLRGEPGGEATRRRWPRRSGRAPRAAARGRA